MFQGDLNDVQQLALITLLSHEASAKEDREWQEFRTKVLIAGIRPENVADVLETLDGEKEEVDRGVPEFATPLTEEEMQTYVPFSMQETDEAIEAMRRYGVSNTEIPDR